MLLYLFSRVEYVVRPFDLLSVLEDDGVPCLRERNTANKGHGSSVGASVLVKEKLSRRALVHAQQHPFQLAVPKVL